MSKQFVFDEICTTRFTLARQDFLRAVLPGLKDQLALHSALDVGCGVGHFSAFLHDFGFSVKALDAREPNVAEAKRRVPKAAFYRMNVEDPSVLELGSSDLVLCFGLLYHLENPMQAIRNLYEFTGKLLLVESMCIPEDEPFVWLSDERTGEDQSLRSVAFYPSEGCLVKMLHRAGFPFVWRWTKLPAHKDFQESLFRKRARTMLAASRVCLVSPFLVRAQEPVFEWDLWSTSLGRMSRQVARVGRFVAKPWPEKAATLRRHLKRT